MPEDLPTGDVETVLRALLARVSPDLFGGPAPAVTLELTGQSLTVASRARDGHVGPRREARVDVLPVDPDKPEGPYRLTVPAAAGNRLVRLRANDAVATTLHADEVAWDDTDAGQTFLLRPRPHRSFAGITHVQAGYDVTSIAATVSGELVVVLTLTGLDSDLVRGRAITLAVLTLERELVVQHVVITVEDSDYTTTERAKTVEVTRVDTSSGPGDRSTVTLALAMEVDIDTRRALRADEGAPISHISTPGTQARGPVALEPVVDT